MMQIKTINYAPEGQLFHKDAFKKIIKRSIKINLINGKSTVGVIKNAVVVENGKAVEFTIELKDKYRGQIDSRQK